MKENIFYNTTDAQLRHIYEQILKGRNDGLRPRCLDEYIHQLQKEYPLSFGEAWSYAERMFWDEVGKRYFKRDSSEFRCQVVHKLT